MTLKELAELGALLAKRLTLDVNSAEFDQATIDLRAGLLEHAPALLAAAKRIGEIDADREEKAAALAAQATTREALADLAAALGGMRAHSDHGWSVAATFTHEVADIVAALRETGHGVSDPTHPAPVVKAALAAQAWENRELKRQLDEARAELAVLTRERDMARCLAAGMDELRAQLEECVQDNHQLERDKDRLIGELRDAKEGIFK